MLTRFSSLIDQKSSVPIEISVDIADSTVIFSLRFFKYGIDNCVAMSGERKKILEVPRGLLRALVSDLI